MKTLGELIPYLGFRPTGDLGPLTIYTQRNGKTVYFVKAPPLVPATLFQQRQRQRFKNAARLWWTLTEGDRNAWLKAAKTANLYCTGYNLWVYWQIKHDIATIRTIERLSGQTLLP